MSKLTYVVVEIYSPKNEESTFQDVFEFDDVNLAMDLKDNYNNDTKCNPNFSYITEVRGI